MKISTTFIALALVTFVSWEAAAFICPAVPVAHTQRSKNAYRMALALPGERKMRLQEDLSLANIGKLRSQAELNRVIASTPDRLIVVKFVAGYCRSCRAIEQKYQRLSLDHPDTVFYEVNIEEPEAMEIQKQMEIKVIPTAVVFAGPLGRVFTEAIGMKKFPLLTEAVDTYEKLINLKSYAGESAKISIPQF